MKANEMWNKYIKNIADKTYMGYEKWAFGADADKLAQLVLSGKKTATSSACPIYELEGEELPKAEEYSVILDSKDEAVCIIKTTRVYIIPFNQISEQHAYLEGEGDRTLEYWRNVHRDFFTEELREVGLEFTEEMLVVCEEFEVVYK